MTKRETEETYIKRERDSAPQEPAGPVALMLLSSENHWPCYHCSLVATGDHVATLTKLVNIV